MAAKTLIRSLAGASVPMWLSYMYARLGNEWAGSLLAFISVGMAPSELLLPLQQPLLPLFLLAALLSTPTDLLNSQPVPFLFWFKGAALRKRSKMAS